MNSIKRKIAIEEPVDGVKKMQETLEKQLEVKEKELQDIHDAKARLKNLRNIRVDDGNKVERDVAEIKSLLI